VRPLHPAVEAMRLEKARANIMAARRARNYAQDDVGPPIDPPRPRTERRW
jgi:hypothetical protein